MRTTRGSLIILGVLLTLVLILKIYVIGPRTFSSVTQPLFNNSIPKYHFYLVAPNSVDPFWREVYRGASEAASLYNLALEFSAPRFNNSEEEIKYLDMAITARVDGIITHVSYATDFTRLIDKAYSRGIPVITIDNDAKESKRKAFVGANSFVLGEQAGRLMVQATAGKANIAIIVSNDGQKDVIYQNLKLNGFLNALREHPDMKIVDIYTSKLGILSAEEITQSILNHHPPIDAIYCMDSVDTLGVAQAIVDFNRVGDIKIVGYGDTPEILRYIERGIIYGTVMNDPYKMGYESIKALLEIKEKDNTSTFIDTGVKIITKENVNRYREEQKGS
ncbi:sugar-binding protein [Thermanaeromonas toyohensis]